MTDFMIAIQNAAQDPLVIAFALLVVGVVAAHVLFKARILGGAQQRASFSLSC